MAAQTAIRGTSTGHLHAATITAARGRHSGLVHWRELISDRLRSAPVMASDLLDLVPWLLFGVGLGFICLRLVRAGSPSRRSPTSYRGRHPHGPAEPGDGAEADAGCPLPTGGGARQATRSAQPVAGSTQRGAGPS
jgi:hypothetical protein